jgi:hypothetical protein
MHALPVATMPDCQDETACHSPLGIAIPGSFPNPDIRDWRERDPGAQCTYVIKDSNPGPTFQSRDSYGWDYVTRLKTIVTQPHASHTDHIIATHMGTVLM